jgi:hypothetical protein
MINKDKKNHEDLQAKDIFDGTLDAFSQQKKQEIIKGLLDEHIVPKTKKEDKEVAIPQFDKETFRIASEWWKEEHIRLYDGGMAHVKIHKKWEIMEYLDDPFKGEQIFISYDVFAKYACAQKKCSRKTLEEKYLPTEEKLTLLLGPQKTKSEQYIIAYNKIINDTQRTGYFIPRGEKLGKVGKSAVFWIAGGNDVEMSPEWWKITKGGKHYGFSGRLFL